MGSLHESYRPSKWDEVCGQNDALKIVDLWRRRGLTGKAIWISGKSGTGKTTIARLIAAEAAEPFCITEVDAGRLTEASASEAIRNLRPRACFEKRGRVLIVNEAHRLDKHVVGAFLTLLETDLPDHALVIFTTTVEGAAKFDGVDDSAPFLSRCEKLPLSQRSLAEPFAKRAAEIARREQLAPETLTDDELLAKCIRLAKDERNNLRAMLSAIASGALLA
jgi:replication-associated recombination protein RarA